MGKTSTKYTTEEKKAKIPNDGTDFSVQADEAENKKTVISNDAYAICEKIDELINTLRMRNGNAMY